jgi:hypothetical protein
VTLAELGAGRTPAKPWHWKDCNLGSRTSSDGSVLWLFKGLILLSFRHPGSDRHIGAKRVLCAPLSSVQTPRGHAGK